jgi:hypothetical protein
MARAAAKHKNFFIAKFSDSESAQSRIQSQSRLAQRSRSDRSHQTIIAKKTAAQCFSTILTFDDIGRWRVFRIARCALVAIVAACVSLALVLPRQHFLKRDAVFFDVLVYSG